MESGRLYPGSPLDLTCAMVSSIARRGAEMVAEIAREGDGNRCCDYPARRRNALAILNGGRTRWATLADRWPDSRADRPRRSA
jgi:hypothetical protein